MRLYNIYIREEKQNAHPVQASSEDQLKAFIEIGLQLDLSMVEVRPFETIKPSDLTFEKTSRNSFVALNKDGEQMYTCYIEKGETVSYIDKDGIWDNNTRTPLEWFRLMPNFNLTF